MRNHNAYRGGVRIDPVQKELSAAAPEQEPGYIACYGMDKPVMSLGEKYSLTAIFLLGHELRNHGLLGMANAYTDSVTTGQNTWHLKQVLPIMRKMYINRALSGWYT